MNKNILWHTTNNMFFLAFCIPLSVLAASQPEIPRVICDAVVDIGDSEAQVINIQDPKGASCGRAREDSKTNWFNPDVTDTNDWSYTIARKLKYCLAKDWNEVVLATSSNDELSQTGICQELISYTDNTQFKWYEQNTTDKQSLNYFITQQVPYCSAPSTPIVDTSGDNEQTPETNTPATTVDVPDPRYSTCEKARTDSKTNWFNPNETDPSQWNYKVASKLRYCLADDWNEEVLASPDNTISSQSGICQELVEYRGLGIKYEWYSPDSANPESLNYFLTQQLPYCDVTDIVDVEEEIEEETPDTGTPATEVDVTDIIGKDATCKGARDAAPTTWFNPDETDTESWNYKVANKLKYCLAEDWNKAVSLAPDNIVSSITGICQELKFYTTDSAKYPWYEYNTTNPSSLNFFITDLLGQCSDTMPSFLKFVFPDQTNKDDESYILEFYISAEMLGNYSDSHIHYTHLLYPEIDCLLAMNINDRKGYRSLKERHISLIESGSMEAGETGYFRTGYSPFQSDWHVGKNTVTFSPYQDDSSLCPDFAKLKIKDAFIIFNNPQFN